MPDEIQAAIDHLRTDLLAQIRDVYDQLANLRAEVKELRLRNEKLESGARRY
jgi:cell division protein FtsB